MRFKTPEVLTAELSRLDAMSVFELKCRKEHGAKLICGVDEAGRGPLAGPVVAAAVVLPENCIILGLNDSKKLSAARREALFDEIMQKAVSVGLGSSSCKVIDQINILQATLLAMETAVGKLSSAPDFLLLDAVSLKNISISQESIVKGDAKSVSIAAASIIAKVTRDRLMNEYDKVYPKYGFTKHKGYGTAEHIAAIKKYGLCPIHRRSFTKNFIQSPEQTN